MTTFSVAPRKLKNLLTLSQLDSIECQAEHNVMQIWVEYFPLVLKGLKRRINLVRSTVVLL